MVATTAQAQLALKLIDRVVTGISADGTVAVGYSNTGGFRYNRITEAYDALAFLPYGVNRDGSLVVGLDHPGGSVQQWSGGVTSGVSGAPALVGSLVLASDAYRIAGYTLFPSSGSFVFDGVTSTPIPVVNGEPTGISADGSTVVGTSSAGPYVFQNGVVTELGSTGLEQASGISDDGSVILGLTVNHSAFLDSTGLHLLPVTPDEMSYGGMLARAASANGSVLGGEYSTFQNTGAFVWTAALGTRSLSALFDEPEGWDFATVSDISANGDVLVGTMWNGDGSDSRGFILSGFNSFQPVPEPATYGMLGVTLLAGTIAWRRRRGLRG